MVFWFVRGIFLLLVAAVILAGMATQGGAFDFSSLEYPQQAQLLLVLGACMLVFLGLAVDFMVPQKKIHVFAGVFLGVLIGLLLGVITNSVINMLYDTYGISKGGESLAGQVRPGIFGLVNLLCCYWAVMIVLKTKDSFRFIIPYVEFSKQKKGTRPLLLDTSVIIDGRIVDIAATRIFDSGFVVPRFILDELQVIADSSDKLKRNRGRRGLDILNKMKADPDIDIEVKEVDMTVEERNEPTDLQLVTAVRRLEGRLVTNDFNLNKLAKLRGVEVININDLARSLKVVVIPGEELVVYLVKPGDQSGQAVGYLDDGTMVVVEGGRPFIGQEHRVVVTSALQTSAGRMVFAKTVDE
ncbi:MAG: PIN domain nuclease [Sedimentisphaerales bacterium]|nr:PIN domain nuclease [Sedimentisphaerales bacterium]MBN2843931.1 PIN domain nuclease [Sedimentisphaerales bacterium]